MAKVRAASLQSATEGRQNSCRAMCDFKRIIVRRPSADVHRAWQEEAAGKRGSGFIMRRGTGTVEPEFGSYRGIPSSIPFWLGVPYRSFDCC